MADTGRPAFCCGRAHVAPAWLPDTGSARLNVSMSSTTLAALRRTARLMRERAAAARRDERGVGESLALLVLWPMLVVAVLVLLVHAFIVTNAQAEAEVAASAGLRAAWRSAANEDFLSQRQSGTYTGDPYTDTAFHPAVLEMGWAAEDAAARAAATKTGWRWWTPGATAVHSDWCNPAADRPGPGQSGWVRVVVSGEVFGPLAALWPNRLDRVHAAATGPAVLLSPLQGQQDLEVPADLPPC